MKGRTDLVNGKKVFPWNAMEVHLGSLETPRVQVEYMGRTETVECPELYELISRVRATVQQRTMETTLAAVRRGGRETVGRSPTRDRGGLGRGAH